MYIHAFTNGMHILHAYILSAMKLIIFFLLHHVLMVDEHEPPQQEANTVAFLQPSDLPDAAIPLLYIIFQNDRSERKLCIALAL